MKIFRYTFSKKEFIASYNNHLPSKWVKFVYKYFSKETEKKNLKLKKSIVVILLILFAIGFVGTIIGIPAFIILWVTISFFILMGMLSCFLFTGVLMNNVRIKKIIKELGTTRQEYNDAVEEWENDLK